MHFARVLSAALLVSSLACGSATKLPVANGATKPTANLVDDETKIFSLLAAADSRLAERFGVTSNEADLRHAGMNAILNEDTQIAIGQSDLFAFDARARALAEANNIVMSHRDSLNANEAKNSLEIELLTRLLREEDARLRDEKDLPRGAPALLRRLAVTWRVPSLAAEIEKEDARLSRRLAEVSDAVHVISPELRDEIEHSLDDLERLLTPVFAKTFAALVKLRIQVSGAQIDDRGTSHPLNAFVTVDAGSVDNRLLSLIEKLGALGANAKFDTLVTGGNGCKFASGVSRLGSTVVPPERDLVCAEIHQLAHADSTPSVFSRLHDEVVVALWAWRISCGTAVNTVVLANPTGKPLTLDRESELTRDASFQPARWINDALAIEWVIKNGETELKKRALAWEQFGDAPIDIAIRELTARLGS